MSTPKPFGSVTRYSPEMVDAGAAGGTTAVCDPDAHGDYVLHEDHADAIATLTRERDEARAELAMAYTRALQAAASVAYDMCETRHKHGLSGSSFERVAEDILALTLEDIERITKEHEHG